MRRQIINHHKIIRTVDRKLKKTHSFWAHIFHRKEEQSRDFAWEGRRMNPYKTEKISFFKRISVQVCIIAIAFVATVAMGIYSSFFKLDSITIEGLQRIKEDEIKETIKGILDFKSLNILPQSSYFTANTEDVCNILKERFPIEKIIVQKKFPDKLSVIIEEKISTVIYDSGEYYSYIDLTGKVVEVIRKVGDDEWSIVTQVTTSTNEMGEIETHEEIIEKNHNPDIKSAMAQMGNYPIVYYKKEGELQINDQIFSDFEIKTIIEWFNLLTKATDIPLKYFIVEDVHKELNIKTYEGWFIKSRLGFSAQTQTEKLLSVLREGEINRAQLQYIDLRYPDRIYWR